MEIGLLLLTLLAQSFWTIVQVTFIIVLLLIIKKFKFSGQKIAVVGFIFLFITMIFSIFHLDTIAGKIAEFVWILFAVAFAQQFYHFLKHENK